MSYVVLPSSPAPMIIEPQQIDYGGVLSPPLGATDQRVNRNGNRWALRIQMPLMEEPEAGLWVGALTRGQRYGVRLPLIQADVNIGIPGSPLVNGSGQAGDTLNIKGMASGYDLVAGQWFNHVSGGFNYLYKIALPGKAIGLGTVTATIEPPLRAETTDNEVLEFEEPVIEGLLVGQGQGWTIDAAIHTGLSFTIRERR